MYPYTSLIDFNKTNCESEKICEGKNITQAIIEFEEKTDLSVVWQKEERPKIYRLKCFDQGNKKIYFECKDKRLNLASPSKL